MLVPLDDPARRWGSSPPGNSETDGARRPAILARLWSSIIARVWSGHRSSPHGFVAVRGEAGSGKEDRQENGVLQVSRPQGAPCKGLVRQSSSCILIFPMT
jgi:hypothetical protein